MPVIGRLDGQVDEVIIKPISERRREEESPAPAPTDADERAPVQTPDRGESSSEPGELPVWLL